MTFLFTLLALPIREGIRERRRMLDPIAVERAETELNSFIEKRAQTSKAEREREELWKASIRKYRERHRRAFTWEWYRHYAHLSRLHSELAEENGAKAADVLALLEEPGGGS